MLTSWQSPWTRAVKQDSSWSILSAVTGNLALSDGIGSRGWASVALSHEIADAVDVWASTRSFDDGKGVQIDGGIDVSLHASRMSGFTDVQYSHVYLH